MRQAMFEKVTRLPDEMLAEIWSFSRSSLSDFIYVSDALDAIHNMVHENLRRGRCPARPYANGTHANRSFRWHISRWHFILITLYCSSQPYTLNISQIAKALECRNWEISFSRLPPREKSYEVKLIGSILACDSTRITERYKKKSYAIPACLL